MGKPPVYDRAALALSDAERDRLRAERGRGVWRFLLDQERIEWEDGILGPISINSGSISDPVLIKADGQVLYTLASVVDDIDMGVTDIVRGADHVTNTATQIQIIRALGGTPPAFAHHSLLTGAAGEALSKRLGTLALRDLRERGIQPMALLSLMARLGSSDPVEFALVHRRARRRLRPLPLRRGAHEVRRRRPRPALGPGAARDAAFRCGRRGPRGGRARCAGRTLLGDCARQHRDARRTPRLVERLRRPRRRPRSRRRTKASSARRSRSCPEPPYGPETWAAWTEAAKAQTGRKGKGLFMPLRLAVTGRERGPEMADVMPLLQRKPAI